MADVWIDRRSIEYGDNWRQEIRKGISSAEIIYIFWCRHAAESLVIQEEIKLALASGRKIIPVRFSRTPPLPNGLSEKNAIEETTICEEVRYFTLLPMIAVGILVALITLGIALIPYSMVLGGGSIEGFGISLGIALAAIVFYISIKKLSAIITGNWENKSIAKKMKEALEEAATV